eukprot:TRINITY_DN4694_c0_g1_i1.p1 TRINITY_DN4694_c0_g1~~TRINITY_DN4694_c0_g1_i1.p1  ORF type:complete len:281 (-),score=30.97 TRINITY_DN4694_c0_g1_i1:654-1388(-)
MDVTTPGKRTWTENFQTMFDQVPASSFLDAFGIRPGKQGKLFEKDDSILAHQTTKDFTAFVGLGQVDLRRIYDSCAWSISDPPTGHTHSASPDTLRGALQRIKTDVTHIRTACYTQIRDELLSVLPRHKHSDRPVLGRTEFVTFTIAMEHLALGSFNAHNAMPCCLAKECNQGWKVTLKAWPDAYRGVRVNFDDKEISGKIEKIERKWGIVIMFKTGSSEQGTMGPWKCGEERVYPVQCSIVSS